KRIVKLAVKKLEQFGRKISGKSGLDLVHKLHAKLKDELSLNCNLLLKDGRIIPFKIAPFEDEIARKKIAAKMFLLLDEIKDYPTKMFADVEKIGLIAKGKRKKEDEEIPNYKDFNREEIRSDLAAFIQNVEPELLKQKLLKKRKIFIPKFTHNASKNLIERLYNNLETSIAIGLE